MELTPVIKDSFLQFSGAVLQSRALMDARDCIKPSARQIFYCLYTDKFIHSKPFQKTLKAIGSAFRMYIHGDASCEGVIMRAGQPFAMRYPLIEVEGSYGTLLSAGSWAAPRYTSARLSPIAEYLFKDIDKNVIKEWRDNYDNTEQYPMVLPSKGFFNLVNGGYGIGVGASGSLPQYNLKELNEALITLLNNPDASFDEIYCAPDFATGAVLINANEVKESHKNGHGAACKLRSVVEWNSKERCFEVKEIPYMLYTETICKELEEIINSENNPGIERFNDLTGKNVYIKIYLTKQANPDKVLKFLYKNTSLQSYYSINMTMLENGRYPRIYTWKELLQAHINHEKEVYKLGFEFDLDKINKRLHIINGLLKAINMIDEVVKTIKASTSASGASIALQNLLEIDAIQAKAILDIKLAKLAHLEVNKLCDEQNALLTEKERIEKILNNDILLKKEIEKGLREVAEKFGDERRTKILNLTEENGESIETKTLQLSLTNQNEIFISEVSSLYTQKRGGVGNKLKMNKGEYIISTISVETNETILLFTQDGDFYSYDGSNLPIGEKIPIESLINLKSWQKIKAIASINEKNNNNFILFITKNGYIKKSEFSEYNTNRSIGIRAITLDKNDEITNVLFTNNDKVGIVTEFGNFIIIETKDIRPIGRVTRGIRAIKLNGGDFVSQAHLIPYSTKEILSISNSGFCKRTDVKEFSIQGKNTKGSKIQKLIEGDLIADFAPITNEKEILIAATSSCIKLLINDIPSTSKNTQGNKTIKLSSNDLVIGLSIY